MIAAVSENENALLADPADRLLGFTARLRREHTFAAVRSAALVATLLLAIPAITIAWAAPSLRLAVLVVTMVVVAVAVLAAAVRSSFVGSAALLRASGDVERGAMAVVGDELATWLEQRRRDAADVPMVGWLGRDVANRLPHVPPAAIASAARRPLGRVRWLVPIVLVLLLTWLLAEWLRPPWPGALGGGTEAGSGAGGGGAGDADPSGAGGGARSPVPEPPTQPPDDPTGERRPDGPPPVPPPPEPETRDPAATPEAPAPMLELPEQQRFVVPEFVGDGPTRRARMHAAQVERDGGAPPPGATGGGQDGDSQAPPPPAQERFERAAEAAQRARHVPADERPMVKRFFELLREQAK